MVDYPGGAAQFVRYLASLDKSESMEAYITYEALHLAGRQPHLKGGEIFKLLRKKRCRANRWMAFV